jgi:hypothetical protein
MSLNDFKFLYAKSNSWNRSLPILHVSYSLRPKINAIIGFEFCPRKNATLTNQLQKTRDSRNFSHKREVNI